MRISYRNAHYINKLNQKDGGAGNLTVSPTSPIDAGVIYNVSRSFLGTAISSYENNGINSYAIFVQNISEVRVVVVGGL